MLFRTPSKGSCYLKRTAMGYFKGPGTFGFHQSAGGVSAFLINELYKEEMKPSNTAQTTRLMGEAGTDVKASQTWSWHSPYTPRRRWPHSGTRMTCPGRRNRACTRGAAEEETGDLGPVPRSWCSGSQSLWRRCGVGEKGEKTFQFMTFSPAGSQASAPNSATTSPGQAHKASCQGGHCRGIYL